MGPVYQLRAWFVKSFLHLFRIYFRAGAVLVSLPPQCTASIPCGNRFRQAFSAGRRSLPTGHASVPTGQAGLCVGLSGDIVLFLYSERSGNPLGRHFSSGQGAGKQSVAWKLISLFPIFFYLFTVCGLEWCFVVLGGKL